MTCRSVGAALAVLMCIACGQGTAGTPSGPSPSPTAASSLLTAPVGPLLVLLEGSPSPTAIAMVDLAGHEVARTDLDAPKSPELCGAGWITPPTVRVVGSSAFFIDRIGVI